MNPIFSDIKELIYFLIRMFRSKLFIYVIISKDKLEVKNLNTDQTIIQESQIPFSTNRLLIADNIIAENLGKKIMDQLCGKDLKLKPVCIIIHPLEVGFENISKVEKMIFNDFGSILGAHQIIIEESLIKLSKSELSSLVGKFA